MTEKHFEKFRNNTIGVDEKFMTPFGEKTMIYADWTASGRLYRPIEEAICNQLGPYVGNTHTETSITGTLMTHAYERSKKVIKNHVNADENDVLLFAGSGMTGAINKLQRILGLRIPERFTEYLQKGPMKRLLQKKLYEITRQERPVIFITHMEHHSNHTTWLETIVDLEIIPHGEEGLCSLHEFEKLLIKHKDRKIKIASITACSNVTGIEVPYHDFSRVAHRHGAWCFVDFACSGPYTEIDMHPEGDEEARLDAVFLSPHKFLGGPGTPGVVIFNSALYNNHVPDQPGGGTVVWTNPWDPHNYIADIEQREDGGTPPFLQGIKAAMAVKLKEEMGSKAMKARAQQITTRILDAFEHIPNLFVLAGQHKVRKGVISFLVEGLHFNLAVKLLNDHFGIQVRGGCACAGTYGHFLLDLDEIASKTIVSQILAGDQSNRPGWVRMSIHPTLTDKEVDFLIAAVQELCQKHQEWSKDYVYVPSSNEFRYRVEKISESEQELIEQWFGACCPKQKA